MNNEEIQAIVQTNRREREADLAATRLDGGDAEFRWGTSKHDRFVCLCPKCGQRIGLALESDLYDSNVITLHCGDCEEDIEVAVTWNHPPPFIAIAELNK